MLFPFYWRVLQSVIHIKTIYIPTISTEDNENFCREKFGRAQVTRRLESQEETLPPVVFLDLPQFDVEFWTYP